MDPSKDHTNPFSASPEKTTNSTAQPHRRVQSSTVSNIFSLFRSSQSLQNGLSSKETQNLRNSVKPSLIHSFAIPNIDSVQTEKRPASVVSRLNEEINILSSQLNLSNSTISFYSQELQKNSEKLENLTLALEKTQNKLAGLESENVSLKQKIEIQTITKENDKKRFELEQEAKLLDFQQKVQCLVHEGKKEKMVIENYFIDVVTNLNHRFLEEVEYINKKFKEKLRKLETLDKGSEGSDKETDLSTFFIPEGVSMLKNSYNSSPVPLGHLKKSVDFEELDLSLRALYGQISEKNKLNKPEGWKNAAKRIFEICRKHSCQVLRNSFLLWAGAESQKKFEEFAEKIEKVLFGVRCFVFISIVKVEKLGILQERISQRRYLRRWSWKCVVIRWNKKIVENMIGLFQLLFKKVVLAKYKSWESIKSFKDNKFIHEKQLIKKSIDQWICFGAVNSEDLSKGFYQWRSYLSISKLAKLRSMKSLFQ